MARFSFFQSFQYLLLLNIKYSTSLPFIVIIQFNNALLIILCRKKILKINLYIILLYTKIYIYVYFRSILETNCYTIYIIFASFNFSIKKERGKKEIPRPERLHLLYPRHLIFLYRTKKISKINLNPRTVGYIHTLLPFSPASAPSNFFASPNEKKREKIPKINL